MKICEAGRDPCGCNNWTKGIRTINGQYPDDNRDFDINAGDGIEVTPATGGITIAMKAPIAGPMRYIGTVGTGGTVASLPAADVLNTGWVYVAITAGSTPDDTPKSYAIGDMIISTGSEWTVVPAGDDPVIWSQITGKPTTVSGYGITDAYTKAETDTLLNGKINTKGSQSIENNNSTMTLALKRNIDLSTITSSTPISDIIFTAINGTNTDFMGSRIQFRKYTNRSRIWASLYRISNGEESAIMMEQFDSGRIAVLVFNTVNGVVTNHYLLDSTP